MANNLNRSLAPALRASIIALLTFVLAANVVWLLNYHGLSYIDFESLALLTIVSCAVTAPFAAAACVAIWTLPVGNFILTFIAVVYGMAAGTGVAYAIASMDV